MSLIFGFAAIACLFLAGMFYLVCRKLAAETNLPDDNDWLLYLSPHRYRPMQRLLDAHEYRRLVTHPGVSRKMLRRIRSRRIRLFREYLLCLSLDYRRVCKAIELLMVESAQDRPDLATLLVRQRVTFNIRLVLADTRLTLHSLGLGDVDVVKLVAALDNLRMELDLLLHTQPLPSAA